MKRGAGGSDKWSEMFALFPLSFLKPVYIPCALVILWSFGYGGFSEKKNLRL